VFDVSDQHTGVDPKEQGKNTLSDEKRDFIFFNRISLPQKIDLENNSTIKNS